MTGTGDADPYGQRILTQPGDPDFERVAALFPALRKPREVVGVREHPYEVGVDYDGAIQLADDTDLWEQTGQTVRFAIGDPPVRLGAAGWHKRLLEGYLPVVIAECEQDGLKYALTVFGYSEGLSTRAPLFAQIQLRVTNPGTAPRSVALRLVEQLGSGDQPAADPAGDRPTSRPADVEPLTWALTVPPGGAAVACAQVPSPLATERPTVLSQMEFDARLATATSAWRTLLSAGLRIESPEPRINDAARAWLAYGFLNVDNDVQGRSYPHDGAGFYEEVFGYSAALYCNALDLWGYHDAAGRTIESLLALQRDDGLFYVRYGLPDHGAMLMAVCQHYALTGDMTWLQNVAPRLAQLCEWVLAQRQAAASQPAEERDRLTRGLIRFAPYADYQGAAYNYYADAYLCAGLEQAAHVLAALGHADHSAASCPHGSHGPDQTKYAALAERVATEATAYRADILASMTAATIERDGQRLLPIEPDTQRILRGTDYRGGGYYGLVASMLLESGFLSPADPRAELLVGALERRRGLILGMCEFDGGIDHAYTYGYWMNCLQRDDVRRVLLGFYGSLAYGMGRDTYCGVEVTQITTGDPTPTTPHLYSCTQQLRLLRMMLVREDGDVLRLAQAVPRHWLKAGQRVAVTRAPTTFGPVTYAIQMNAAGDGAEVRLEPPRRKPPSAIHVYLRHPAERAPRAAQRAGTGTAEVRGECVILTGVAGPATLQVQW